MTCPLCRTYPASTDESRIGGRVERPTEVWDSQLIPNRHRPLQPVQCLGRAVVGRRTKAGEAGSRRSSRSARPWQSRISQVVTPRNRVLRHARRVRPRTSAVGRWRRPVPIAGPPDARAEDRSARGLPRGSFRSTISAPDPIAISTSSELRTLTSSRGRSKSRAARSSEASSGAENDVESGRSVMAERDKSGAFLNRRG